MRRILTTVFLLTGWLVSFSPAQAGPLLGNTIETSYLFPNVNTAVAGPINSVVGAGVELTNFIGFVDINFSDDNILITILRNAGINNVSFDGLGFVDVNSTIDAFTSVSLNAATNYSGLDASRISFDSDHIFVNVVGLPGQAGQVISLDLNHNTVSVPETATWHLLATGLIGFLGYNRCRRTIRDQRGQV